MDAPFIAHSIRQHFPTIRLASIPSVLARCYDRYLQRAALAELDAAGLRDIGLTEADVRRELAKPFWR